MDANEKIILLTKKWEESRKEHEQKISSNLEYDYKNYQALAKNFIVRPLALWKFIQRYVNQESSEVKRAFLSQFILSKNNPPIGVVAIVESLPTQVWRKILWKHNIDFQSFESFLRRITEEQIRAVEDNYHDLFSKGVVPRVFGLFERARKKITVESLLKNDHPVSRYASKGSWSHNMLGLDFGFNAYINGVTDDTRTEFNPMRFLSRKNHVDDFVVSQEDGKYWWLYRTARSSYGWMWDKTVELKTHICPGFWYTLLIHFLFWLASPAAFASLISMFAAKGFHGTSWLYIIPIGIPAAVTPFWLIIAGLRWFFLHILTEELRDSIVSRLKTVGKWFEEHENTTIIPASIAFLGALAIGALAVICLALLAIYEFLYPAFGNQGIVAIGLMATIYIGYNIYRNVRYERLPKFSSYPFYWKIPVLLIATWLAGKGLIMYHEQLWLVFMWAVGYIEIVWAFVVKVAMDCLEMLWGFVLAIGLMAIFMALPLVLMGMIWLFNKFVSAEKQEKVFNAIFKYSGNILVWLFAFLAIVSLSLIFQLVIFDRQAIIVFMVSAVLFFAVWYMAYRYNPASDRLENIINELFDREKSINTISLFKNRWLKMLSEQEIKEVVKKTIQVLKKSLGRQYYDAYDIVFPKLTQEILDRLEIGAEKLICESKKIALKAIVFIVRGHDAEEAISLAYKKQASEDTFWEVAEKVFKGIALVLKVIFYPAILLWRLLKLITEWIVMIPQLIKLFNERCPFITRTRILSLD